MIPVHAVRPLVWAGGDSRRPHNMRLHQTAGSWFEKLGWKKAWD